jgi:hypothetical protein
MKEMSGESHNQGSIHYLGVLICKASTNGQWRFRMTSNLQQKSEMSYWVAIFMITLLTFSHHNLFGRTKSERDDWEMWKRHKSKAAFSIDLQGKHRWRMEV